MDYIVLISLLERVVAAYDNNHISDSAISPEFQSLIGDIKDALSNIE